MPLRTHDAGFGELAYFQGFADFLGREEFDDAVDLGRVGVGAAYAAFFTQAGGGIYQDLHGGAYAGLEFGGGHGFGYFHEAGAALFA